jgi:hypothetical protein
MTLKIRRASELRRKSEIHYEVMVKDGAGYFLCHGMSTFARHPDASDKEVNCRLCRSIFRGRGLKEHGEL